MMLSIEITREPSMSKLEIFYCLHLFLVLSQHIDKTENG
jgi:hypothetical protein